MIEKQKWIILHEWKFHFQNVNLILFNCFQECHYVDSQKCQTEYKQECEVTYNYGKQCKKVPVQKCTPSKVMCILFITWIVTHQSFILKEKKCRKVPEKKCEKVFLDKCKELPKKVGEKVLKKRCVWPKKRLQDDTSC